MAHTSTGPMTRSRTANLGAAQTTTILSTDHSLSSTYGFPAADSPDRGHAALQGSSDHGSQSPSGLHDTLDAMGAVPGIQTVHFPSDTEVDFPHLSRNIPRKFLPPSPSQPEVDTVAINGTRSGV